MKISKEERKKIWKRYKAGGISQKELAHQYGVVQGAISRIIRQDPDYQAPPNAMVRRREILEKQGGKQPSEWVKPIARARKQADIANEGLKKVIFYARENGLTLIDISEASGLTTGQVSYILARQQSTENPDKPERMTGWMLAGNEEDHA